MLQYFVLSLITLVFVGATEPPKSALPGMSDVPACKALLDMGDNAYKLPHCSEEVNQCFKDAHSQAPKCYAKEAKQFKDCLAKQEFKNMIKNWFNNGCTMHLALNSCMKDEEPAEIYEKNTDITDEQHNATVTELFKWFDKFAEKFPEIGECWGDVFKKLEECKSKAQQDCGNFGTCWGIKVSDDASDVLKTWYKIGRVYEKKRYTLWKEYEVLFAECSGTKFD